MTEETVFLVKHAIQRGLLLTRPISLLDEGPASAYFGGLPQLPSTTPWPKLRGCSGSFLAQTEHLNERRFDEAVLTFASQ